MPISMSLLFVTPVTVLFLTAALGKLRHERLFRFKLINMGLSRFAHPMSVRLLAFFEIFGGIIGLSIGILGIFAIFPMLASLICFTIVLLVRRPESCGCGTLETGWLLASLRNVVSIGFIVLAVHAIT
jgi:hypothetical protein